MKAYITAQARARAELEDKLEENALSTLQHLAYLYVFPQVRDTKHWRNEIWKFYHRMSKIRIGRKVRYLTAEEFLAATYYQHNSQHTFEYVLQAAPELETDYAADYSKVCNVDEFKAICDSYFQWLAREISSTGEVLPTACYNKLQSLGL